MDDTEPIIESNLPKVDDRPLSSLGQSEFRLPIDADDRDGGGPDDAVGVAAFGNYVSD